MKIAIISDHTGYELKDFLIKELSKKNQVIDLLKTKELNSNYAKLGIELGEYVIKSKIDFGIAICGTGIGISIAVNKVNGIIGALCNDLLSARFAKKHNNANVICLGARMIGNYKSLYIVNEFLMNKFEKGRHTERINTILEYKNN